jgi:hypothetical protein
VANSKTGSVVPAPGAVRRLATGFTFTLVLAGAAQAQRIDPAVGGPGPSATATRSTAHYLEREQALQQAIASANSAAIGTMLDTEFEVRTPAGADAVAGADWITAETKQPHAGEQVRDLTVFESGDLAIVSFLLESPGPKGGKHKAPTRFIVDVWQQSSGKLQMRYLDTPAKPPPFRERPDGRD